MSEPIRVLDKLAKDKINDYLENLREMQQIEIQLQLDSIITTLCTCDIESWLQKWKQTRERKLEYYTCLTGILGDGCRRMKVADRFTMIRVFYLICEYKGAKPPPPVLDANPSQLQALHAEHLQNELDLLEKHIRRIRWRHRFLADKLRSKVVV